MQLPKNWIQQDDSLILKIKCQDFKRALALVNSVGDIAESLNHHPDLQLQNYNEVTVTTTTHSEGKLTDKDYQLANEISDLLNYETQNHQF